MAPAAPIQVAMNEWTTMPLLHSWTHTIQQATIACPHLSGWFREPSTFPNEFSSNYKQVGVGREGNDPIFHPPGLMRMVKIT